MVTRNEVAAILEDYRDLAVVTVCSHSSLQLFHGARQEGFRTIGIAIGKKPPKFYDAFDLADLEKRFRTVIDSGLFHVFGNRERIRFRNALHAVMQPGGMYFMMAFSDKEPTDWGGPRRMSKPEILATFAPPRFRVRSIEDARFETHHHEDAGYAYLSIIDRL